MYQISRTCISQNLHMMVKTIKPCYIELWLFHAYKNNILTLFWDASLCFVLDINIWLILGKQDFVAHYA